jgi:hypothetical protein
MSCGIDMYFKGQCPEIVVEMRKISSRKWAIVKKGPIFKRKKELSNLILGLF